MRVLVASASRSGATGEIARTIGEVLESRGLEAPVLAAEDVGPLEDYDAVVLGSAVYLGHWLAPALDLSERIGRQLAGKPIWLFSSGPVGDPSHKLARQMAVDPVDLPRLLTATGARGHTLFAGKLDRRDLRGLQRASLFFFRSLQGDFRNWPAIRSWADSIAGQLLTVSAAP